MSIQELSVTGFRSLKDITWRPGNLNVIIGPNGSGKSNLLRVLEMISLSAQGRLAKYVQSEGGFDALLWDGRADAVEFRVTTLTPLLPGDLIENDTTRLTYKASCKQFMHSRCLFASESLTEIFGEDAASRVHLARIDQMNANILQIGPHDEQELLTIAWLDHQESFLSTTLGPLILNSVIKSFGRELVNWVLYQNIDVGRESSLRKPNVSNYTKRVANDGQNLIAVLHTLYSENREFKETVNEAMRAAFGDDFEELIFPPAADQRIQMRVRWKSLKREQSTADLSDGTLRFLFLLTVLAGPNPPPLIAIDEPETGLHPSMLPIVAELAVNAALRTQVIFTTHSDQFLDAFRETATQPTTTVARWENGETTLTTLDNDALQIWLKDYTLRALYRSGELESGLIG